MASSIYRPKPYRKQTTPEHDDDDDGSDTDTDIVDSSPSTTAPKRKKYPRRMWIERDDFDMLLDIVDRVYDKLSPMNFNLRLLYTILYWSGLRISEALLLSRGQIIEFINGQSIQVTIPKTNSTRSLLNTNHIYEQLAPYRDPNVQAQIADVGFANAYGDKLTFRRCQKWSYPCMYILQMQKLGKVDDPHKLVFTLHSFRSSFINRLLRNQVALPDVSQIIGHKNVSTTLVYARAFPDMQRYNSMLADVAF